MIPRAVKRKQQKAPPTETSSTASASPAPIASTSRLPPPPAPAQVTRLGQILLRLEESLSDWALSSHQRNGLLGRIKASLDAGGGGEVHLQHILPLAPIRALTDIQADVQKAVRLRESEVVELSEDGFHLRRKGGVEVDRLENLTGADWDSSIIYIENIPPPSQPHLLSPALSALLRTPIQRLVLPPLFNPSKPPSESPLALSGNSSSQRNAFAASKEPRLGQGVVLPQSGGPFKGFAIVIVGSEEDAQRIVRELPWVKEGEKGEVEMEAEGESKVAEVAKTNGMRAIKYSRFVELRDEYLSYQRSIQALNRAQPQRARERDREPRSEQRRQQQQQPQAQQEQSAPVQSGKQSRRERHAAQAAQETSHREPVPERPPRSPSPAPPPLVDRKHPAPSSDAPTPAKRARLSHLTEPPSTPDQIPSTLVPSSASESVTARGGFPRGCVIWVRNVHEKSSKTTLRGVWAKVLEKLEEGSGKGVEFVDYDKGLDTCYIRFSSPHLSTLLVEHLASKPYTHISPHKLYAPPSANSEATSDSDESSSSSSEPEDLPSLLAERRPVIGTLLSGDRERLYWEQLPEAARKTARKSAGGGIELMVLAPGAGKKKQQIRLAREKEKLAQGGAQPAGLAKAAREQEELRRELERKRGREESGPEASAEAEEEGEVKKRKKPSRV